MTRLSLAALVIWVGCGGAGDASTDARVDADPNREGCWPEVAKTIPHGSLTLGLGRGGFHDLPENAPMEWGFQDGFMFVLSTRMTGFPTGDPMDFMDPRNPYTKIMAYFDDTNVPLNRYTHCAFRNAYKETGAGDFELNQEVMVMFETCWRMDRLLGQRIRIEAEILDPNGNYASDIRVVTAAAPTTPGYPNDTGSAPCPPL